MNPSTRSISRDNTKTKHNSSLGFGLGNITKCHSGREPREQRSTEYYSVSLIDTTPYRPVLTLLLGLLLAEVDSETTCC